MKTDTNTSGFCNMLVLEHRQAEDLMQLIDKLLLEGKNWSYLKQVFETLKQDMNRHFFCEEKAFFPVLSQYKTMILMAVEHDDLFKSRDAFESELNQSMAMQKATDSISRSWNSFKEALSSHIKEEEEGVFPMAEDLFEPEEKLLVKRKLDETANWAKTITPDQLVLDRQMPSCKIWPENIFQDTSKPLVYEKLFSVEHAGVYNLFMAKKQALSYHWAPEHLYLVVIEGEIIFKTDENISTLKPGYRAHMEPRKYFSLEAVEDSRLILFKIWPRPHFIRR